MPRRDGTLTPQETIALQRAGYGPEAIAAGQIPPAARAQAALAATSGIVRAAASATPVTGSVLTVAAVNAAAAGILGAFDRFLSDRRSDQEQYVVGLLESEVPDLPEPQRLQLVSDELDAEKTFATKARARLDRDLPKALSIAEPGVREAQVQKVLDRERRYAEMRESAMATRTLGAAEQRRVEIASPEGGYWRLSPYAKEHTLDCLAMGGKVWPHSVLRTYHPPLHGGCPCEIWTIKEAEQAGELHGPHQYASPDQSLQAMQIAEATFDEEEFAEEVAVLEAAQLRWWKGTVGPGQFRAVRGDIARGLRRARGPRTASPVEPDSAPIPTLGDELDLRRVKVADLAAGDRVVIGGEIETIKAVIAPSVVELEDAGVFRLARDEVLAIQAAPPEAAGPTVTEAGWEHEHRTRSGEWTFTDLTHAKAWATNEFSPWLARLSPEHRHSIAVYKHAEERDPRYRQINRAMRGRAEWTTEALRHAPLIDHALSLHKLSSGLVLHRGMPLSDLPDGRWPPETGRTLHEPAFMSTSLVPLIPEEHYADRRGSAAFMHITVPAGIPAGYADPVDPPSGEGEILLPPGVLTRVDYAGTDESGNHHIHSTFVGFERRAEGPRGGNA